ncbi:MAG: hypothetical protein ACRDBG_04650 [Waterburya sp.]
MASYVEEYNEKRELLLSYCQNAEQLVQAFEQGDREIGRSLLYRSWTERLHDVACQLGLQSALEEAGDPLNGTSDIVRFVTEVVSVAVGKLPLIS